MLCASVIARSMSDEMPTATALVCSMNPARLRSVSRGSGTRTDSAASNDE